MADNTDAREDEISLIDLFAVLLHYKVLIIAFTVSAAVLVLVFSIVSLVLPPEISPLPNKFSPQATMLIKDKSSSKSDILSGLSGLSSLASLAGISTSGGSANSSLALYLISSNSLLDAVTDKFDIIERYKIKEYERANSRKALQKTLTAEFDDENGVFKVTFTDIDGEFACDVVNFVVDWLSVKFDELGLDNNLIQKENLEKNIQSSYEEILKIEHELEKLGASVSYGGSIWSMPSIAIESAKLQLELKAQEQVYTQLKTQYELLKVEMQSEVPVFQILERPEVPDMKSSPSRGLLCIITTFAAFFISVFLAFALNAWKNIRSDPDAARKLNLKTKKDKALEKKQAD